jgi:hypothetical protein
MRNDLTPFRTVRELLVNRDEVLMSNAVGIDGQLYEDSVENLTAILAMQDSYNEMLAALEDMLNLTLDEDDIAVSSRITKARAAIAKAKGAAA